MTLGALRIAQKDLNIELRTRERMTSMILLSLVIVLSFRFAFFGFDVDLSESPELVAPILWTTIFFAGVMGLESSFSYEKENKYLDGLLLLPTSRYSIYLGKMLSNLLFLIAIDIATLIFVVAFFAYDPGGSFLALFGVVLLGTFSFVAMGTLVSGMTISARARQALLQIALIPLIVFTIVIPAVVATSKVVLGSGDLGPELRILGGFGILSLLLAYVLFGYLLEG
ncbi:MAG: heme exporter protein CcmB [Thermoplasmata archaeon]